MLHYPAMTEADLDAVVEAERRSHPFPWTRGNFADSLAAGYGAWLAREDERMIGYAVMMLVLDEVHLLNITVLPELQRRGLGSALLGHLFEVARMRAATRMLLEVRPSNVSGQALYKRHGFAEIGRRRDYYPAHAGREDAIVMTRDL
ncbi:MAG: ribosomal-protein-alanine N-acetyltransferase [Rhodocyclales bacterium RIFCSPLOWO2_02_FULL_63_24]|nr:MAG: ribosomal-protein-alanine N-acetyltransferase [Rhodocyclales bacterium GWA2_65_19]OHC71120.1 MAG: ribosomal-protein-alanine N-acetyltransferase [Rhodocyclales bacterium RIFCSPLOWO2_02_FULL_63_24]